MGIRGKVSLALLAAVPALVVVGCEEDPVEPELMSIVETAQAAGSFDVLLAAVEAAGLRTTLEGDGPFTVFAPTDAAFDALPEGTLDSLLQPENQALLVDILTFHVVPGSLTASDVTSRNSLTTVLGQNLEVVVDGSMVRVDGALVAQADIMASNGVIHVIDRVLLPE
jgi:uncharacterized surface protein with fasciclin (FAS1) repeats